MLCEALLRQQRSAVDVLQMNLRAVTSIPRERADILSIAELREIFEQETRAPYLGSRALNYLRRQSRNLTAKEKAQAWEELTVVMRIHRVFTSYSFIEESGNRFAFVGPTGVALIIDFDGAAYLTQVDVSQIHERWTPTFRYSDLELVELNKFQ